MKNTLLLAALSMMSVCAMAEDVFTREMPCKNDFGEVIGTKMGTICLPYDAVPVDCSVYSLVSASADEWIFKEVKDMQANTPYVFVVDNNTTLEAGFTKCGEEIACENPCGEAAGVAGAFIGGYKRKVISGINMYYISNDKVNCNKGLPVMSTPYRGYFSADVMPEGETLSENVKLTFIAENATRIQNVDAAAEEETEYVVGRQNLGLEAGKYQINGKKIIVK